MIGGERGGWGFGSPIGSRWVGMLWIGRHTAGLYAWEKPRGSCMHARMYGSERFN